MSVYNADTNKNQLLRQQSLNSAQRTDIQRLNSNDSLPVASPIINRQADPSVAAVSPTRTVQPIPISQVGSNTLLPPLNSRVTGSRLVTTSRLEPAQQYNNVITRYPPTIPTVNVTGVQQMKSTSKIQYIPFEKKIVEFRQQQRVEKIPRKRKIIDYREQIVHDMVPREVVKQDYYAIEHLKQYIPEYVPEKVIVMVEKAVPYKRIQYVPVTRQVYHGAPLGNTCTGLQLPNCSTNFTPVLGATGQTSHGISNAQSFAGLPPFYQNYSGEYFSNAQFVPSYPADLSMLGQTRMGATTMNNRSYGQAFPGVQTSTILRQQFRNKMSTYNDSYDTYIPSFKY